MIINVLTKNPGKFLAAKTAFSRFGIKVNQIKKDFPEVQAETSLEIARFTALQAARELSLPVVREDHSLFFNTLGIPGPYTNFIEKKLPAEKVVRILDAFEDRTGYFEVATVYAEPEGKTKEYTYQVPILFARKPRGHLSGGWNRIIKLKGETRTIAEYPEEERIDVWTKNYVALAKDLIKNENKV